MITSAWVQVRALLRLRWQMVRHDGIRGALILTACAVAYLVVLVANGVGSLDPAVVKAARDVAPQAFFGFGVLAFVAPLTAGGGNEIFPPDQLVTFPIKPRTQFLGGLLLAPVNLVWVLQLLALVAETALLTSNGNAVTGALTTALYALSLTALGQSMAWTVVALRQSRRGRQVVAFSGAGLLLGALLVVRSGTGGEVLDASPTRYVPLGVTAGAHGHWLRWSVTTSVLALLVVVGLTAGARTCAWALRRPGDAGASREAKAVHRRRDHRSALRLLVANDRGSVWRAPALRRGGLVLAVLPGLAAAGAQVPWQSVIVLPGLVAAGAGLLFGINAFCLDGSGAIFLASLPHDPRLIAWSKTLVLTETVFASVVISALSGGVRSPGSPTTAQVAAIIASGLACTAVIVSCGMAASVRRPHRADLKGPRDAVAPPGALTLASVRLVLPAGLVAVIMGSSSDAGIWWLPLALAVPVLALCAWSLSRSAACWADPLERARIVQVVSAG